MRGIALVVGCLALTGAIAPAMANGTTLSADTTPTAKQAPLVKDAPPAAKQAAPATKETVSTAKQACPGHPDALGTSRVLTISADEFSKLGTMQYKQTLPLKDHEVVLTFDDGPLPPYSSIILDTLESQCVKATYFMVGEMAHNFPYLVRRIYNAGNTIGTHSLDHPLGFQRLSAARVEHEVDGGIAAVDAAIGNPKAVAPFFRIPGLGRSKTVESFLASKHLITWSADVVADDWFRGISPQQIIKRAITRLDKEGRGILLLHDIHPATAMALPTLLRELKQHGYHVVQVVPAGDRPKSVPEIAVAHETAKSAWPTILQAKLEQSMARPDRARSMHHARASRHHAHKRLAHTVRKRHRRALASLPPREDSRGRNWQLRQF